MMHPPMGSVRSDVSTSAANWREVATSADRQRLRTARDAWIDALQSARNTGNSAAIDAEGALLRPDAAIAGTLPQSGDFNCRVIKLGAKAPGMLGYIAYPRFRCRISQAGSNLKLEKLSGSQRPIGVIYPDTDLRAIFLGTLALGDEVRPVDYGSDAQRDIAGIIERIGPSQWRMIMPHPAFESLLDVMELVPIPGYIPVDGG